MTHAPAPVLATACDEPLTVDELAARWRLVPSTIRRMIAEQRIAAFQPTGGKNYLITRAEIDRIEAIRAQPLPRPKRDKYA